jgi:hypothetical protein
MLLMQALNGIHSHMYTQQKKMANTKGIPLVTVLALGSSFTRGQTSSYL